MTWSEHPGGDRRPRRSDAQAPAGGPSSAGERSDRTTPSEHPGADRRPRRSDAQAPAGGPSSAGERSDRTTWRPLPEPGGRPPRPVSASLDAVTRNLGGDGAPALVDLLRRWPAVVGEQLAAHCRPVSLRSGTLTLAADEPGWGAQLGWLEADLRRRLDDALGAGVVTRIAVRIRPR